ncbi:MAG TPA: hypothetical protein VFL82_09425 [Thermomicrobiales bacterium]|nr:hypothetical protein [Thermomicrobiales bacterium]
MMGRSRGATMRLAVLAAVVLVAIGILIAAIGPGIGGDSSPTATAIPTAATIGDLPLPKDCQVAPRALESLIVVNGTPVGGLSTPGASPTVIPATTGSPADPATITAIKATYREAISCLNAGQFARTVALYSDDYARRLILNAAGTTNVNPQVIAAILATPAPLSPTQWTTIRAMGNIQQLSDGRVSAVIVTQKMQSTTGPEPRVVIFIQQRGRWVIDDVITPPGEATPAG